MLKATFRFIRICRAKEDDYRPTREVRYSLSFSMTLNVLQKLLVRTLTNYLYFNILKIRQHWINYYKIRFPCMNEPFSLRTCQ